MEGFVFTFFGFVLLIAGSFIVRAVAAEKGRSPMAYFWLSVFLSPIVGGIVLGLHGNAPGFPKSKKAVQPDKVYTLADYRRAGH